MKKIMIAALAAVAVGAANAACEKPNACVFAYRFKMAGKTVAAKVKADSGACAKTTNCWAKAASLRIAGYVWDVAATDPSAGSSSGCCDCSQFGLLVQNKAVFWTVKYDSTGKETKPQIWKDIQDVDFSLFEVLRNSGAKDKAQMSFAIDGIQFAGFGSYNPETKRLKRANGFFAGIFGSYLAECETCDQPMPATVFTPCTLAEAQTAFKIAYGRWNLAWKHEKVAALEKGAYSSVTVNGLDVPSVLLPSAFVAEQ